MRPERADFKPEKADLRSRRAVLRPERADFRPEKADLRSRKADLRPERANFRPEKANLRSRRADLRPERAGFWPERADFRPEESVLRSGRFQGGGRKRRRNGVVLCGITGHRPQGRCPKRKEGKEQGRIHGHQLRVGRGGNARFHTFRLVLTDRRTNGPTDGQSLL